MEYLGISMPRGAMKKIPKTLRTSGIENILEPLTLGIIYTVTHQGHIYRAHLWRLILQCLGS